MSATSHTSFAHDGSELLHQGVEHLEQGISIFDNELRLVARNRRFCELLAFPEELCRVGTSLAELFRYNAARGEYGEGDAEEQVQIRLELARRGESHRFERERPDGTILEICGNPLPGGGFVTTYTDVTERRRAEQALGRSEQRLRAMFEHAAAGIMIASPDGTLEQENRAFRQMLGYTGEEMRSLNWWDLIDPKDRPHSFMKHEELIKGEVDHYRSIKRYLAKDGTILWGDATTSALYGEQGELEYTFDLIIDITEQKQAEERMLDSEHRYRSLTEAVPCAIYRGNPDDVLTFEFVNPHIEEITGYPAWSLISNLVRSYADIIHPEDRDRVAHDIRTAIAEFRPWELEYRVQHADGSVRWVRDQGKALRGPDGQATHRDGFLLDETQRRRAEEDVRAQERRLQENLRLLHLVLNTIPVRVYWKDRDLNYLGCNQLYARDAGHQDPDEIVGRNDREMTWGEHTGPDHADEREVMETRAPRLNYEETRESVDGHRIWLRANKMPLVDVENRVIGVLGTYEDITARRQADQELQRLRNLLANIVNSMPSALVGVDSRGLVTQWNREAEKLTGLEARHAQGQPLEVVFPRLRNEMQKVREAIHSGRPLVQTEVAQQENDEIRYDDITIYPLVSNGTEGAVIRIDDVTERVRIEEMMLQSEKMLSVGGLAAGMAHEINNPLAGILQNIQVVRNRLNDELPKNREAAAEFGLDMAALQKYLHAREVWPMVEAVRESGQRAARIVDNMLSFSRKSQSNFAPHDLADLLERTLELVSSDYDLKKSYDFRTIKLERDYTADLPHAWCEASQLQQVFLNLLKNAAEAMRIAGVSNPRLRLSLQSRGDVLVVEIEDNGPGMDEATRRRVFEPFFTTKEVGVGTGLGLSVSYFIVTQNHDGAMSVNSTPGEGTCFTIELPVAGHRQ